MKKLTVFFAVILILVLSPCTVFASDCEITEDGVLNEIYSLLPSDIGNIQTENLLEPSFLWQTLCDAVSSAFPQAARSFATVLGLIIISSVIGTVRESIASGGIGAALDFAGTVCICAATVSIVGDGVNEIYDFVSELTEFVSAAVPVVCAVIATSGRATLSAGVGTVTSLAVSVFGGVCNGWLLPLAKLSLSLLIGGNVCTEFDFSGFLTAVKKLSTFLLAVISTAITVTVAFQSVITKGADDLIMRGVKFAAGAFIPYVGGAVSDAISTIKGSIGVIGATAGISTAVIIAVMAGAPLARLAVCRAFADISSGVASLLGRKKERAFFSGISDIIGLLIAVVASAGVVFIIAVSVLAASGGE